MSGYALAEHDRMLSNMLIAGTIDSVDHGAATCRVRSGDWVSGPVPWASLGAGQVRNWRPPSVGEQAMLMSPSGDPENGFALPGFYTSQHAGGNDSSPDVTATDWPDGARESYNHANHQYALTVPAGGEIRLQIGASSLVITDQQVTIKTPKLLIDAPESETTGALLVRGLLSFFAGLAGRGLAGRAAAHISGDIVHENGVMQSNNVVLHSHEHTNVYPGDATSGGPTANGGDVSAP